MAVASLRQDDVLFAPDMPSDVNEVLQEAVALYEDTSRAEDTLWHAYNMAPDRLEVYVALYKFYFYKNKIEDAEDVALLALRKSAELGGFPSDWRVLNVDSTQWIPAQVPQRFYLYTLKALAFINLRFGRNSVAEELLDKLAELDPEDQVGHSVIRDLRDGTEGR